MVEERRIAIPSQIVQAKERFDSDSVYMFKEVAMVALRL
jgi:hypothetical protein